MRSKLSLSLVLSFFAVTMTLIAMVREFLWAPPRAFAQGVPPDRDVYMVIDLSTGKMWGFPTLVQAPYPPRTRLPPSRQHPSRSYSEPSISVPFRRNNSAGRRRPAGGGFLDLVQFQSCPRRTGLSWLLSEVF
jgi:hypothetical protein